jgi:HAD superfamily hydrolase (TIGR01450 family)
MTSLTTIRELAEKYGTLLFDSYGVLVNESHGLPGALELIRWLERSDKSYFIVTNDASMSIPTRTRKFVQQGVPVPPERIINSGLLIPRYVKENGLTGAPTLVFGSPDAVDYVRQGGAKLLPLEEAESATVFVLADDGGFDWRPGMNTLLSALYRRAGAGLPVKLLLPNPDLVYPTGDRQYSFAAASLVVMVEAALERLFGPREDLTFTRLGKPFSPIFEEARRRAGGGSMVMIGDQIETDIMGANAFGIPSAIVTTGIGRLRTVGEASALPGAQRPTYLLTSISLE